MNPTTTLRHFLLLAAGSGLLAVSSAHAADVTWDVSPGTVGVGDNLITGGAGTWNTTNGNWTIDAGANNILWDNANNDTAVFGDTAGTVSLGTGITVGGLQFDSAGYIIAGNTLTFGAAGNIVANADASISSILAGSAAINKTGSGSLTLSGNNTYTGALTLTSGTLRATTSANALGTGAATLTLNGGTLELVSNANPISWAGTGVTARPTTIGGDVTIVVNRATPGGSGPVHTLIGAVGIGGHTVTFQGGDNFTSGAAQLQLGTTTLSGNATFDIKNPTNGGVTQVIMRGAGMGDGGGGHSLTVEGSGSLRFLYVSGSSTWTGGTNINGGEIHYRNQNNMPTVGNTAVNDGGIINVRVGGSGSWTFGTARGSVGGLLAGIGSGLGATSTVTWNGNVGLAIEGGGTTNQLFYDPTGSTSLELELRSGTLNLSGNNSYSGGTKVTSGTVRMDHANALGSTSGALTVNTGGTLNLNNQNLTVGNLTGTGGTIQNTVAGTRTLTIGNGDATGGDFQGNIVTGTGDITVTKTGTGILTLSGANTYTGGTLVSNGTLLVNNLSGSGTGSGEVTVLSAATLGGTGTIGGSVTLNGGRIAPGASIGTLNTGTQNWDAGSIFQFEFSTDGSTGSAGSHWDRLAINGDLNITAPTTIELVTMAINNTPGALAAGLWDPTVDAIWAGFVTTTGDINGFNPGSFSFDTSGFLNLPLDGVFSVALGAPPAGTQGNSLDLIYTASFVIPEPSRAILFALGLLALLGRRRR